MKKTILLVDDEDANLELLQGLLKDDYTLVCAKNGPKALSLAAQKPDLILLDVMMPGMDGYEVCRRLKINELTKGIPIILVASKREMADEIDGLKLGAADYIAKPITALEVKARVKTLLALRVADKPDGGEAGCEFCHALNLPVDAMVRLLDQMLKESSYSVEQKKFLLSVRNYGFHAQSLLNLSRAMPSLEKGSYTLQPVNLDLLPLIRSVRSNLASGMRAKGLTFKIQLQDQSDIEKSTFFVRGDKMLCYALLSGLVRRAVASSPNDQAILLSIEDSGSNGVVRINDMGKVPDTVRDQFFAKEIPNEGDWEASRGGYVAKLITELHGGKIRMRTYDTKGTEVVFSLPKGEKNG
ncbi:MAG: response regulator [Magnetococcus sp. XQGC-1]